MVPAEGADEALLVVGAIRHVAIGWDRDGNGRPGREISTVIAPLPVNDPSCVSSLVFPDDFRAPDSYSHSSPPVVFSMLLQ